jgi:2-methylcitrate dehydratase PrpD
MQWEMQRQYFKPHAICRWAQPAVEAALRLREQANLDANSISTIEVRTFHEATRLAVRAPATTEEAQYSLPFAVAVALVHGNVDPEWLMGSALQDLNVLRLARLVELREDPGLSRQFPQRRLARIRIETRAGARFELDGVEPRWEEDSPPTDEELIAKFRRLTQFLPEPVQTELLGTILDCQNLSDATVLADQLARLDAK